jgi:SAM-dependent methyltransferase
MRSHIVFFLLAVVALRAQSTANPTARQTDPGPADYYGAYALGAEPQFNPNPNAFLITCVRNRKPGKALDVGMGSGRNALYLAAHGWDVTGFDIAEVGVAQARSRANKLGLKLNAIVQSDADFDFGIGQWDLIVLTYQPFRNLLAKIKPGLKTGGIVVIENFHRDTRRDRLLDEDATYRDNELLELFSDFRILRYEDIGAKPDWGIEFPKNRLVRLEAQRGSPQQTGCDWKGSPRPVGATVKWGVIFLSCTNVGWIRVEVKGMDNFIF